MTDQGKQKFKYWLIGLFTGAGVATPITAFFMNKLQQQKVEEAKTDAAAQGYDQGINDMAAYSIEQQQKENTVNQPVVEEDPGIDPNDIDTTIDEGEDAEETRDNEEAHSRYLDMIERYSNGEDIKPYMIDADKYILEQYMEKSSVNWYDVDNVFEEDLSVIEDPYATFGVTDGHDLFKDSENRHDPDICYVRNEKITTDFEISRIHGSYAKIVGGEANLGETNS